MFYVKQSLWIDLIISGRILGFHVEYISEASVGSIFLQDMGHSFLLRSHIRVTEMACYYDGILIHVLGSLAILSGRVTVFSTSVIDADSGFMWITERRAEEGNPESHPLSFWCL
jgi:hypothetical protein